MELLNADQRRAFDAVVGGRSVFITGPGGTGKSFLLQTLYAAYRGLTGKQMAVTALTGCAALLLGPWAKTLHSWAGIGLGRGNPVAIARTIATNGRKKKNWRATSCLVIDEISMMTPYLLEFLDTVGRHVRKCDAPFGGLQVVFVGDFYQLPPVTKDLPLTPGQAERLFAFESPLWKEIVQEVIPLRTIIRQHDPLFQKILGEARVGALSPESYEILESRKTMEWKCLEIRPTLIFTKNQDVAAINSKQLSKLDGPEHIFTATSAVPPRVPKEMADYLIEKLDKDAPYEVELKLKERAQVMLITNQDPEAGCVNGSRGVITGFGSDGVPLVKFLHGPPFPVRVAPATWAIEVDEDKVITRQQIPLKLAYAMTCHRMQGQSLDAALVDIGPSTFEYGQAYVALSRVRSLEGLFVFEIHPKAFKAHPLVKAFYEAALPPEPEEPAQAESAEPAEDPYQVLGIPSTSKEKDIKKAYRKLAVKFHPDKNPAGRETFEKIQKAYETLCPPA